MKDMSIGAIMIIAFLTLIGVFAAGFALGALIGA